MQVEVMLLVVMKNLSTKNPNNLKLICVKDKVQDTNTASKIQMICLMLKEYQQDKY